MFEAAARLQAHNQEMVKYLSQLRSKRQQLLEKVTSQQQARVQLQHEIDKLQQQLRSLDESLEKNRRKLDDQDRKLLETETGYNKVVDAMHMMLIAAKKDEMELMTVPKDDSSSS